MYKLIFKIMCLYDKRVFYFLFGNICNSRNKKIDFIFFYGVFYMLRSNFFGFLIIFLMWCKKKIVFLLLISLWSYVSVMYIIGLGII